jgi:hypothetical protein
VGTSALLSIDDVLDRGLHRVQLTWRNGTEHRRASTTFRYSLGEEDAERIRWYLEELGEFPAEPLPGVTAGTETRIVELGTELFLSVFSQEHTDEIWSLVQGRLADVRIEIKSDSAGIGGLPWEIIRERLSERPIALKAQAFVRAGATAEPPQPAAPAAETLRVLLVICRPSGGEDVPFRSVASRLVRGGGGQLDGLDLDVLRPPTFRRLGEVLLAAAKEGRPYHVVHFDGHGAYLDASQQAGQSADGTSLAGPVRPGRHGYLIFEDAASPTNQQLVDGPALGDLLRTAQVPVAVLNACRSAYAESPPGPAQEAADAVRDEATAAARDRVRAYGSLAAEVAEAGVPGVVAMQYNVYVVTAAQFVADLYALLLAGKSLGEASTEARRRLAEGAARQLAANLAPLQDWFVPVVYEPAPLTLSRSERTTPPLIEIATSERDSDRLGADHSDRAATFSDLPASPESGFFGRDETLLAIDRAFDSHQAVLLHALAGAGKSATAAEFARWYGQTGGLRHAQARERGSGYVVWSSFDRYLSLDRLVNTIGDACTRFLEAEGIHWHAITERAERRRAVLQILKKISLLWIWDNVESVAGFPAGAQSDWDTDEQQELADFLRDLTYRTRCKVLLTSRRDERAWLGDVPVRVTLPPMPMRESLQLAQGIASLRGQSVPGLDWRPLLRYAAGNPLTITVLVGQAHRENLAASAQIEELVGRLRSGETDLEQCEDATLGRGRSLSASLEYGLARAFTDQERGILALIHLFRGAVPMDALYTMGLPDIIGDDAISRLAGIPHQKYEDLLSRLADSGLLTPSAFRTYTIHPALPWYLGRLFSRLYGANEGEHARRACTSAIAKLMYYYIQFTPTGTSEMAFFAVRANEDNIFSALNYARKSGQWDEASDCLSVLNDLYDRMNRPSEWSRIVTEVAPDFIDPATGKSRPGREPYWDKITAYKAELARRAGDLSTAIRLQRAVIEFGDPYVADFLNSDRELTEGDKAELRAFAVSKEHLAYYLSEGKDPTCLQVYQEAFTILTRAGALLEAANVAYMIGMAYKDMPAARDLGAAGTWLQFSLEFLPDNDFLGRTRRHNELASVALNQLYDAISADSPISVQQEHATEAFVNLRAALHEVPEDSTLDLRITHDRLADLYHATGHPEESLFHYHEALKADMFLGDSAGAGRTRAKIAALHQSQHQFREALLYARAALDDFRRSDRAVSAKEIAMVENLASKLAGQVEQGQGAETIP